MIKRAAVQLKIKPRAIIKVISGVIKDTLIQMKTVQILLVASSLAYTTLLSIIPLLAVSFAIFNAFGGMKNLYSTLQPLVLSNLAQGASEDVIERLNHFISKFFITLGPLGLSIAVGFVGSESRSVFTLFPSGTGMYLLSIFIFFLINKFVPHAQVRTPYALISGWVTATIWKLATFSYALYTKNVLTYNKIYGSLAAIPILMLWIYIAWIIILGGAALTASLQKRVPQTLS
ncbi:MAG: YihY/virulence factor BrkB family protein [Bdellovibrio sp.]|nr:YihY/virulence factor BrkB family protein [Bdellovibrio sp.]